jgi:hypothetical protein
MNVDWANQKRRLAANSCSHWKKKKPDTGLENRNVVRFHLKSGRFSVGSFEVSYKCANRNQSGFGAVPVPKSVIRDFSDPISDFPSNSGSVPTQSPVRIPAAYLT